MDSCGAIYKTHVLDARQAAELLVAKERGLRAAKFRRVTPTVRANFKCRGYHPFPAVFNAARTPVFAYTSLGAVPFTYYLCEACYLRYVLEGVVTGEFATFLQSVERPSMQFHLEL